MDLSACKSCKAPVYWVPTANGKKMPLDVEPALGGNVELSNGIARVLREPSKHVRRYTCHFATCPYADKHRQRGPQPAQPAPAGVPEDTARKIDRMIKERTRRGIGGRHGR